MQIIGAESILLAIPFKTGGDPWVFGGKPWTHFDVLMLRIDTDEGITGWGEAFARNRDVSLKATIDTHIIPKLIGRDPTEINRIKHDLEFQLHNFGRIGPVQYGISAVDIALWDILGKAANLPLYRLLGGKYTDTVRVYASMMRYSETDAVQQATRRVIKEGYRHIKLHEVSEAAVRACREAAGPDITIMLDVNCPWSLEEALEMDRRLRTCDLLWLEEPIWPPENYKGLATIRAQGNHRIAAGENQGSFMDFKMMFDAGAVDIAQPDLAKAGGISEMIRIAALADAYNVVLVPHCANFGPGLAAQVHFNAAMRHVPLLERLWLELEANPMGPSLDPKGGILTVPAGAGLGCDPDPTVIREFRV